MKIILDENMQSGEQFITADNYYDSFPRNPDVSSLIEFYIRTGMIEEDAKICAECWLCDPDDFEDKLADNESKTEDKE